MLSADFVNVLLPITRAFRKCRLSTFFARENDVYHETHFSRANAHALHAKHCTRG